VWKYGRDPWRATRGGGKNEHEKGGQVSGLVIIPCLPPGLSLSSKGRQAYGPMQKRMMNYSTQDSRVVPHRGTN
jgi:hypothetical protein